MGASRSVLHGLAAAALAAALPLLAACDGGGDAPPLPGPPCIETDGGDFWCSGRPGERVVRTAEAHGRLMEECSGGTWPPTLERPPVPGEGEMLVIVSDGGSGCSGCLGVACVEDRGHEVVVRLEGGFEGDCEAFISVGAWALAPDAGLPVRFERTQAPCPGAQP
jgi:hypothetical protein